MENNKAYLVYTNGYYERNEYLDLCTRFVGIFSDHDKALDGIKRSALTTLNCMQDITTIGITFTRLMIV